MEWEFLLFVPFLIIAYTCTFFFDLGVVGLDISLDKFQGAAFFGSGLVGVFSPVWSSDINNPKYLVFLVVLMLWSS